MGNKNNSWKFIIHVWSLTYVLKISSIRKIHRHQFSLILTRLPKSAETKNLLYCVRGRQNCLHIKNEEKNILCENSSLNPAVMSERWFCEYPTEFFSDRLAVTEIAVHRCYSSHVPYFLLLIEVLIDYQLFICCKQQACLVYFIFFLNLLSGDG